MPEKKKLSNLFINAFGLGDFGFQIMVNMELLFFMVFMTDAIQFSPETAGFIGSVTGFFDILWVFVAGLIVQKCNFKWGKLRSWLLFAPPFIWAFFIFQFWGFSGATDLSAFLICMGFIVSHLIWNCAYTAHIAMISAYTDDVQQRTTLSSRRALGQAMGKIVFSLAAPTMIAALGVSSGSKALGYTYTTMILVLIMIICYWVVFVVSKPFEAPTDKKAGALKEEKVPLVKNIAYAVTNTQLIVLILADFGRCFAFYLVTAVTAYYFRVVVGDASKMALYLLLINVASAISALIAPYVAKSIGKKNTYFLGMLGYAIGLITVYMFVKTAAGFMIVMLIANGLFQLSFSMGTAMFADTVIFGEWKSGVNSRGFIMGLYSLPIKTSVLVRAAFMGFMLSRMAYKPDAVTEEMVNGIRNLITIYPAIVIIICGIFGFLCYRLTDKYVKQLSDEIAARKTA